MLDHLSGRERIQTSTDSYAVSSLTVFECLRFPGLSKKEETDILDLLSMFEVVFVSKEIATSAANVARTKPTKKPIDLLIAATALELGVPLVTKNVMDFKGIDGLEVVKKI